MKQQCQYQLSVSKEESSGAGKSKSFTNEENSGNFVLFCDNLFCSLCFSYFQCFCVDLIDSLTELCPMCWTVPQGMANNFISDCRRHCHQHQHHQQHQSSHQHRGVSITSIGNHIIISRIYLCFPYW